MQVGNPYQYRSRGDLKKNKPDRAHLTYCTSLSRPSSGQWEDVTHSERPAEEGEKPGVYPVPPACLEPEVTKLTLEESLEVSPALSPLSRVGVKAGPKEREVQTIRL